MSLYNIRNEYKESYVAEFAQRGELNGAVAQPTSLIIAFFGILYFMFLQIDQPWSIVELIQIIMMLLATCILIGAIYFLIRSYHGYDYALVPTPTRLEEYRAKMLEYYNGDEEKSNTEVLQYMHSAYASAAHQNAKNNEIRYNCLYNAKKLIILTLPLIASAGVIQLLSRISFYQFKKDMIAIFT